MHPVTSKPTRPHQYTHSDANRHTHRGKGKLPCASSLVCRTVVWEGSTVLPRCGQHHRTVLQAYRHPQPQGTPLTHAHRWETSRHVLLLVVPIHKQRATSAQTMELGNTPRSRCRKCHRLQQLTKGRDSPALLLTRLIQPTSTEKIKPTVLLHTLTESRLKLPGSRFQQPVHTTISKAAYAALTDNQPWQPWREILFPALERASAAAAANTPS